MNKSIDRYPKSPSIIRPAGCGTLTGSEKRNSMELLQHLPVCPACRQECHTVLILPCSHTMCSRCVAAGGPTGSCCREALLSACSILCPCCRRYVELPCWSWGCATSCLPKHPSIKSEHVSRQMGFSDDSPEDCPHHAKVSCDDIYSNNNTKEKNIYGLYYLCLIQKLRMSPIWFYVWILVML